MLIIFLFYGLSYGSFLLLGTIIFQWIRKHFAMRQALSDIPGPKSFPFIGLTWQFLRLTNEDRFKRINSLSEQFKSGITILWLGTKPKVNITKPEIFEAILTSNELITKSKGYDTLKPWLGNGLLTSTGDQWFKHRKMITPAFHFNVLENYTDSMRDNVKIFTECIESELRENAKAPINIFEFAVRYTLDTICESAMGVKINCQRNRDVAYAKAVHEYSELSLDRVFKFWLKWDVLYFLTSDGKKCRKALQTMHSFTEKVILQKHSERKIDAFKKVEEINDADDFGRMIKIFGLVGRNPRALINQIIYFLGNRKKKAFLDLLLDESEKAVNQLTFVEIRQEVDTFMFGGHDTTAAAISWALFALGHAPEIQDKVYEEMIEVFGADSELATTKQLGQLKYLDRVIKEAMRLYTIVPSASRYVDKDIVVGDYLMPKGTTLGINIYMLHRDPDIWEDPEKFDPDRFLPENIRSKSPYAFVPFSAGPRNCIGQKFANLELKTALTAIIRRWKVTSVLKPSEVKIGMNLVLRPIDGKIEVYFKPRN